MNIKFTILILVILYIGLLFMDESPLDHIYKKKEMKTDKGEKISDQTCQHPKTRVEKTTVEIRVICTKCGEVLKIASRK